MTLQFKAHYMTIEQLAVKLSEARQKYREAYKHMCAHGRSFTFTQSGDLITREDCYKVLNITPLHEE